MLAQKIEKILWLQWEEYYEKTANSIANEQIAEIENILSTKIPDEIKNFWKIIWEKWLFCNTLFTAKVCDFDEIQKVLKFAKNRIKLSPRNISKEHEKKYIWEIIDRILPFAPKHRLFGLKKSWDCIEVECGADSLGWPYMYKNQKKTVLKIESFEVKRAIINSTQKFQESEKDQYNWDEIIVKIFPDKNYELERKNWDFWEANFISLPEKAIHKKYFHLYWIPLFSDCWGNYIGVDLDPDEKWTFWQIINFGYDEEKMYVFWQHLEDFFDRVIQKLEKSPFDKEGHFIDDLKECIDSE